MKKRIVLIITIIIILFIIEPMMLANDEESFENVGESLVYNNFEYSLDSQNQVMITKYNGTEERVDIPESIDEYMVIGIASFDNENVREINIPATVTSIVDFCNCENLININVDENNTSYCSKNGILFNKDMTQIVAYPRGKEEVYYKIPDGIVSIRYSAFKKNDKLVNIDIPESVTSIGSEAFLECKNLIKIVLPNEVKDITYKTFQDCTSLKELKLPNSLTSINSWAFLRLYKLRKDNNSRKCNFLWPRSFFEVH